MSASLFPLSFFPRRFCCCYMLLCSSSSSSAWYPCMLPHWPSEFFFYLSLLLSSATFVFCLSCFMMMIWCQSLTFPPPKIIIIINIECFYCEVTIWIIEIEINSSRHHKNNIFKMPLIGLKLWSFVSWIYLVLCLFLCLTLAQYLTHLVYANIYAICQLDCVTSITSCLVIVSHVPTR